MSSLFEPLKFCDFRVKNRIIIPPYYEGFAQPDGQISLQIFERIAQLAGQGAGTIILNNTYVCKQGKSHPLQMGLAEENHITRLQKLVKQLKEFNVLAGIRLSHAGAKTSERICGEQPISPYSVNLGKDYDLSRPFDDDDVEELCLFFAHAIERAEEIGFDFVELNGAQQQLLDQCISSKYNLRDDKYGETFQDRMRLPLMLVEAMRKRVKSRVKIGYFFSIYDKIESGFSTNDLQYMLESLSQAGVDFFHPTTIHVMNKFFDSDKTLVEWVEQFTDKPLVVEGNIKSIQVLKEVLSLNKATLYGLDKSLFLRPNWSNFLRKKIDG